VVDGGQTSATFSGVTPGVALEFTVTARFGATEAPASDASLPVSVTPAETTTTTTTSTTTSTTVPDSSTTVPDSSTSTSTTSTSTSTTSTTSTTTTTQPTTTTPPVTQQPTTTTTAPTTTTTTPPTGSGLVPGLFSTWSAFTTQVLTDFTGSAPKAWVDADAATLAHGRSPGAYLVAVRRGTDARLNTDPVLRLYRAYFGRPPSPKELDFWVGQRRKGVSLFVISDAFARSSEFARRHGKLSNTQYVNFVLTSVGRGRPPKSAVTSWVDLLDAHVLTRGQVMALQTEGAAYKRETLPWVDVVATWIAMLDRAPKASELTSTVARLDGGTPLQTIMDEILGSAEYRARFMVRPTGG